jgi:ABC-type Mn2+/Zn2+ transport system ATPase subunit
VEHADDRRQPEVTPVVDVRRLVAGYDGEPVLLQVSFSAGAGRQVGIVGPNGSGKTTIFRVLLGMMPPTSGEVRLFGQPIGTLDRRRHPIGYLPQSRTTKRDFPVSARDVVSMGRVGRIGVFRFAGRADREAVDRAIAEVGLADKADRPFGALSGGEQQRFLLARALVAEAQLIILDEPVNGLDVATREQVDRLVGTHVATGGTALISTHDLSPDSLNRFDWLICLRGEIVAQGPPLEVAANEAVRRVFQGLPQVAG